MENESDKKLKDELKEYLKTEGISIPKFSADCFLPNGKPLTITTLYRQFDKTHTNMSEKIRHALTNHEGFKKFRENKEKVSGVREVRLIGLARNGVIIPPTVDSSSTMSFENTKLDDNSHFCIDQHPESQDLSMISLKPLFKKKETSPTLCHNSMVYVTLKMDWYKHNPTLLNVTDGQLPAVEKDSRVISNFRFQHFTNFYGHFEFLDKELHDTDYVDNKEYFELNLLLSLLPFNSVILFPIKAINTIHRIDLMLEPIYNQRKQLAEVLKATKTSAIWSNEIEDQFETFISIKYAGLLDTDSAKINADKVIGRDRFYRLLDELFAGTSYKETQFDNAIHHLKNSDPTFMFDALEEASMDSLAFIRANDDFPKPALDMLNNRLKILNRIRDDWFAILKDWKLAFNSHCQMQIEMGSEWKGNIKKRTTTHGRKVSKK